MTIVIVLFLCDIMYLIGENVLVDQRRWVHGEAIWICSRNIGVGGRRGCLGLLGLLLLFSCRAVGIIGVSKLCYADQINN